MLEKMKNWLDKPYTRKDVVKYNAGVLALYGLAIGYLVVKGKLNQNEYTDVDTLEEVCMEKEEDLV